MPANEALSYIAPGDGESIQVMTDLFTFKARSENGGGAFILAEVSTPPQGGPPMLHRHFDQETFYVLEGVYRFDTLQNDQPSSIEVTSGSVIHIPSRVWHNYKNIGTAGGRMIVILQPGDMLNFFRELGVPSTDKASIPHPSGSPDMGRVLVIMEKHHVEMSHL